MQPSRFPPYLAEILMQLLGLSALILESSEDGILVFDTEGTIHEANSTFLVMALVTMEPVIGNNVCDALGQDFCDRLEQEIADAPRESTRIAFVYDREFGDSVARYYCTLIPYLQDEKVQAYLLRLREEMLHENDMPRALLPEPYDSVTQNDAAAYSGGKIPEQPSAPKQYYIQELSRMIYRLRRGKRSAAGISGNKNQPAALKDKKSAEQRLPLKKVLSAEEAETALRNHRLEALIDDSADDLKHVIHQLQSKSQFLDSISMSIPGVIFLFNLSSRRIEYVRNNIGLQLGEIAADKKVDISIVRRLVHPDDCHLLERADMREMLLRNGIDLKLRIRLHNDTYHWFHLKTKPHSGFSAQPGHERFIGVLFDIDDFMEAELKLKENEMMLERAQRVAKIGSWEWSLSSGTLFWTAEIYRIFEQDPEQFNCSYSNFLNIIHPADRSIVEDAVGRCLRESAPFNIVHRIQLSTGSIKFVRQIGSLERDEYGAPVKMIGTVQDITSQVEVDQKLQAAYVAIESSSNALFNTDASGKITYANPAAAKMWGYSSLTEMFSDKPRIVDYFTRDSRRKGAEVRRSLREKGYFTGTGNLSGARKQGDTFYVLINGSVITNTQGETTGMVFSCFDITEKMIIERTLKEQRDNYQSLYENALVGIFRADVITLRPVEVNDICTRIFGYEEKQDFLRNFDFTVSCADPDVASRVLRVLLETGKLENEEIEFRQKNGHLFWGQISVKLIKGTNEAEAVVIDVSERKHYEKVLSEKVAEKELLLREIHHRVKNNLQIISGLLQLQLLKSDSPQHEAALHESKERIQAIALVHEKLYSSDSLAFISFANYLRDLTFSIVGMKSAGQIDVTYNTNDFAVTIERAIPLGLICNELITNSIKHAFKGQSGHRLLVTLLKREQDVVLSISDNGDGFDPQLLTNGSGIGWKLVTSLVKQIKGRLEVESGEGKGSRISIFFE